MQLGRNAERYFVQGGYGFGVDLHGYRAVEQFNINDDTRCSVYLGEHTVHAAERTADDLDLHSSPETRQRFEVQTGIGHAMNTLNFVVFEISQLRAKRNRAADAWSIQHRNAALLRETAKYIAREQWQLDCLDAVRPAAADAISRYGSFKALGLKVLPGRQFVPRSDGQNEPTFTYVVVYALGHSSRSVSPV